MEVIMSRTYRRRKGPVPSWVTAEWIKLTGYYYYPVQITDKKRIAYETAKYHSDACYTMQSTPSYWIHDYHTVPRRRKTRDLSKKILRLDNYEDAPEFPLDKKPYIYYW